MIKRILTSANFYAVVAVNIIVATDMIKDRIQKLADTEEVSSAKEYVLVKLARGDYRTVNDIKQIRYDYEFYNVITTPLDSPLDK